MYELFATTLYAANLDQALMKINYYIVNPLIRIMFAIAFILFVWGIIEYTLKRDSADGKEKGRQHIMWGLVGLAIMTSVFYIVKLVVTTFGIDEVQVNQGNNTINVEFGDVEVQ